MNRFSPAFLLAALAVFGNSAAFAQDSGSTKSIPLPSSKILTIPSPGRIGSTNSFPATIAISPNGRYAAMLNDGYGTQETLAMQSIAVLDLKTNQLVDFPDKCKGRVHKLNVGSI